MASANETTIKDLVYQLLSEPTREKFRDFMKGHTGEQNDVDFKEMWIDNPRLTKLFLAIANSGGGIIVFGVKEDNGIIEPMGLERLKPKAEVHNTVYSLIPETLEYELHDISYEGSDYEKLIGKKFQLIIIKDQPQQLPFLAKKDADKVQVGDIYIRRGTKCEKANSVEVEKIINRRIETQYSSSAILDLDEHVKQLEALYAYIEEKIYMGYSGGTLEEIGQMLTELVINTMGGLGTPKYKENPYYPEESFDEFIARMITMKKRRIENVLGL